MTTTIDKFTEAYIECALWSSCDENDRPLDDNYGPDDLAESALASMCEECQDFRAYCVNMGIDIDSLPDDQAGHDFWLTRNRHGAGFWDRGLGDLGKRLTEAAHSYGSSDIYVGDDGKLYVS